MARLDQLRMRRTASSYGEPLTFLEELELARIEAELDDLRRGRALDVDQRRPDPALMTAAVSEGQHWT
jgi:hypothetical protein